jgi:two-component system, NtrC family, response regulator PilR
VAHSRRSGEPQRECSQAEALAERRAVRVAFVGQPCHNAAIPAAAGHLEDLGLMAVRILFVEDDEYVRDILRATAQEGGYDADFAPTAEVGVERLAAGDYDIVVTDVRLPGMNGIELLPHIARLQPGAAAIVITAFGTVDIAVEAMKRGAIDFLTKPFTPDELLSALRVASERVAAERRTTPGERHAAQVIGTSAKMRQLLEQVAAIAPFNSTVLITGETGTGKELVARAIHAQSPRTKGAIVALNCAAIPEQLLEDELFGHVKGAFTGAQGAREGRFEQANGGTLFLDEIGDMSLAMQSKLLRVLQEREFERLGSSRTVKVDVRIVAATSANLERRIEENTFRPDLFYRLNVVHLRVPPLRERPEDIRPLAEFLLRRFSVSAGIPPKTVDDYVWDAMAAYKWPGNVRQLQNCMERSAALSGAAPTIMIEHLPEEVRGASVYDNAPKRPPAVPELPDEGVSFDAVVTRVERDLLLQSLDKAGGNKMRAAKLLNMKRTTFIEKLKRLQIGTDDEPDR